MPAAAGDYEKIRHAPVMTPRGRVRDKETSMKEKSSFRHMELIRRYAGGHYRLITLGRILAGISALMALVPYYDLWNIIRIAVDGKDTADIRGYAWQAVMLLIGSLLVYITALLCTHIAAFRVQANLRSGLMHRIVRLPLGIFDEDGTGKIRRIVNDSTAATETYIAHNLADKAVAMVTPVGLIVLILAFNWKMGLFCMIPALIGFACMMAMMGRKMQEKMAEYQTSLETMSSEATEYVRGIPVVKTFGQTVHSFKRFKESIDSYGKWTIDYTLMLRLPMVGFMTCINAIFLFIVIAAFFVTRDGVTAGNVLNIMYYIIVTPLVTVALTKVAYSGEAEMTLIDALKRVQTVMDLEPLPEGVGKEPQGSDLELRNVSYRYKGATRDAVSDVSMRIRQGEHVALVGPSGSGKTTLAELMARFFDTTGGEILLGGVNVREISQARLMQAVSFVFQDSRLLRRSILDNIRMARPDATEAEVAEALRLAQCSDILEKLPNGIHTVLGEKGTYLSGGEQQRLSIARAFLKDAPILILDEATAYAAPDNESKVQAAFAELAKGRTVIMIAHRLSTVVSADRIYVMDDGRLTESGTHESLMKTEGLYRRLYEEYTRSIAWKVGA